MRNRTGRAPRRFRHRDAALVRPFGTGLAIGLATEPMSVDLPMRQAQKLEKLCERAGRVLRTSFTPADLHHEAGGAIRAVLG